MAVTSINNPNLETTYINGRFMSDLTLKTQMVQFCSEGDVLPQYQGDTVRWIHFPEWPEDITPLSQTDPADNLINLSGTFESVEATVQPYGAPIYISDFLLETASKGTMDKIAKRAADAGRRAIDRLAYNQCVLTTTILKAQATDGVNGSNPLASGAILQAADFSTCRSYFETSGCYGFDHLGGQYGAVVHPNAGAHVQTQPSVSGEVTWAEVNKHIVGAQTKLEKGENGSLFGVRIFESPIVTTTTVDTHVAFQNVVLSHDGLGCTQIRPANGSAKSVGARVIITKAEDSGTYQPTITFDACAWKWTGAMKLLAAKRIIKLYSAINASA